MAREHMGFYSFVLVVILSCSLFPNLGLGDPSLPPSQKIEYLIVYEYDGASGPFHQAVKNLAAWKSQKGLTTSYVSTDYLTTSYAGIDDEEKIRNGLKWFHDNRDTKWVLLLGDYDKIPPRCGYDACFKNSQWMWTTGYLCDEDSTPTDLYYADLDSDWDSDGDWRFGECREFADLDFEAEVYVGRIAAESGEVAQRVVDKIIKYEKDPPVGNWMKSALLAGAFANFREDAACNNVANPSKTHDAAMTMETLKSDIMPGGYLFTTLYEQTGVQKSAYTPTKALTQSNLKSELDKGYGIVAMSGHGSYKGITRTIWYSDVDGDGLADNPSSGSCSDEVGSTYFIQKSGGVFQNSDKQPFIFTIACLTNMFDHQYDSLAEWSIKQEGGAIGYLGSTRSSAYWPGYFDRGNDHLLRLFMETFFQGYYSPGEAYYRALLAYSIAHPLISITYGRQYCDYDAGTLRNHYTNSLQGDPETPIWTDVAVETTVTGMPDIFQVGKTVQFEVTVTADGSPVKDARISLSTPGTIGGVGVIHDVETTDASGKATFENIKPTTENDVTLVVTKHNYKTVATNITAFADDTAPVTSVNVTEEIWYDRFQYLKLVCDDGAGIGCEKTLYCIDDVGECEPNTEYSGPVLVSCDLNICKKYVRFRSKDEFGNTEGVKTSIQFKIDQQLPVTLCNATDLWKNKDQTVKLTCGDGEGSGCKITNYCIDDEGTCLPGESYDEPLTFEGTPGNVTVNYVRYHSVDNAANTEDIQKSKPIRIDKQVPTTSDNTDTDWHIVNFTLELSCDDSSGSGCNTTLYCIDTNGECDPDTVYSDPALITCPEKTLCTHYVRYLSNDTAGNEEDVLKTEQIKIDNQKPSTSDDTDGEWHDSDLKVTLICDDGTGAGCHKTFYCLDTTGEECTLDLVYTAPIDVTCAEGETCVQFVRYRSIDAIGFYEEIKKSNQIKIDKQKPTAKDTSDGEWHYKKLSITLTCFDNSGSNCDETLYCVDTDGSCTPDKKYTIPVSFECASGNECIKRIRYWSKDKMGNEGEIRTSSPIKLINKPPTTADNGPSGWNAGEQTITLTCTNKTFSPCDKTFYCIDTEGECTPETEYSDRVNVECAKDKACIQYVRYFSKDAIGQLGLTSTSGEIKIDRQGPATFDDSDNSWHFEDLSITLTCDDGNGVGCDTIYYCIDPLGQCTPDKVYSKPIDITCELNQNCKTYIAYLSTDALGNKGTSRRTYQIKISKRPNVVFTPIKLEDYFSRPHTEPFTDCDTRCGTVDWFPHSTTYVKGIPFLIGENEKDTIGVGYGPPETFEITIAGESAHKLHLLVTGGHSSCDDTIDVEIFYEGGTSEKVELQVPDRLSGCSNIAVYFGQSLSWFVYLRTIPNPQPDRKITALRFLGYESGPELIIISMTLESGDADENPGACDVLVGKDHWAVGGGDRQAAYIYLYYGNEEAASTNSGTNTFDFFDDFTGTGLNTSTWAKASDELADSEISVSDSILTIEGSGTDNEYLKTKAYSAERPAILRTRMRDYTSAHYPSEFGFGYRKTTGSSDAVIKLIYTADKFSLLNRVGTIEKSTSAVDVNDDYHTWEVSWASAKTNLLRNESSQGSLATNIPSGQLFLSLGHPEDGAPNTWKGSFDWVLVRKYASEVPLVVLGGADDAPWWHNEWEQRLAIGIVSNEALEDYQVKVVLDTAAMIKAGLMNDDCSDIRFTSDRGAELPHWLENDCNSPKTVVWVRVPTIPEADYVDATCCGDDSGEHRVARQCQSGCVSAPDEVACCDDPNDCVFDECVVLANKNECENDDCTWSADGDPPCYGKPRCYGISDEYDLMGDGTKEYCDWSVWKERFEVMYEPGVINEPSHIVQHITRGAGSIYLKVRNQLGADKKITNMNFSVTGMLQDMNPTFFTSEGDRVWNERTNTLREFVDLASITVTLRYDIPSFSDLLVNQFKGGIVIVADDLPPVYLPVTIYVNYTHVRIDDLNRKDIHALMSFSMGSIKISGGYRTDE